MTCGEGGPAPGEFEISLFGPGYGESIAVHVGIGRWLIVDSCKGPSDARPAVLDYLDSIGVDLAQDVIGVVATHWHEDHIRGMAEVLAACSSAKFYCSLALQKKEFLVLTELPAHEARKLGSGIREFRSVLSLIRSRGSGPRWLGANTLILDDDQCQVRALSPSDAAIERALVGFRKLLEDSVVQPSRLGAPTPNEASTALWLTGPAGTALLGADLEHETSERRGWAAAAALEPRNAPAALVKVPHHGGESAHDSRMWEGLLVEKPEAVLTRWSLGANHLPTGTDEDRLRDLAPEGVVVGTKPGTPGRYRSSAVEKTLTSVVRSRRAAVGEMGHVRARTANGVWSLELIRNATRL